MRRSGGGVQGDVVGVGRQDGPAGHQQRQEDQKSALQVVRALRLSLRSQSSLPVSVLLQVVRLDGAVLRRPGGHRVRRLPRLRRLSAVPGQHLSHADVYHHGKKRSR